MTFNLLTNEELTRIFYKTSLEFLNQIAIKFKTNNSQYLSHNHIKRYYDSIRKEMIKRRLCVIS